ncbi:MULTISPECIES: helix-turn-helix domain-containing protein [Streptomyces]|uniref:Helix-turn-helix transcriptional regulator n=1 Tax=Streptomyces endophyticus TaxID=714166 RepID=A0ABU6F1R7_9ACTN|nr:helix-turn-helix transcriptional regulator [Streptomyces endophyticus]MEB8336777.1 helix-turn-helix transcriptional regulator [Streptomyces endophyticus]
MSAELGTEQAAVLIGSPRNYVANLESGRTGVSAARVRAIASSYGGIDDAWSNGLAALTAERGEGWWERDRGTVPDGFLDIAEMEWFACGLRVALSVHLPGLLQTEEHARALFGAVFPPLSEEAREARIAHRLGRSQVLDRPDPPLLEMVIHEAALRMEFGGRLVAKRQLTRILDVSERDKVQIRVIPFAVGAFPGAGQSVTYAKGAAPQLDTALLDSTHGPEFMSSDAQLRKYALQIDAMVEVALPHVASRDFIHKIVNEL